LASPNQSLINFGLFISFFPQLIAGPIVHHKEMMPQFSKPAPFSAYGFGAGLSLLAIGLFKKVMIADSLDAYATPLFVAAATRDLHIVEAWLAALSYTFQIYFDFSGYSDMALGLGKMFGVRLPVNFFSPYKSDNIIDFWRRWHMTLSRFLRDYLYIPLGGNRKGRARRYTNLFITMLLGGFWHGANWTFLVWGALHGTYLVINHLWQEKGFIKIPRPAARLLTFLAVMVAWIFFRAPDMKTAVNVIEAWVNVKSLTVPLFDALWTPRSPLRADFPIQMANLAIALVAGCFILCWLFPNSVEIMRKSRPCIAGVRGMKLGRSMAAKIIWQPNLLWGAVIGLVLSLALLRVIYEPSQVFLYFQF
jgi:D-alanyl-lipoteichoic acid acyltransferase DltB (MBOAT superfamily)